MPRIKYKQMGVVVTGLAADSANRINSIKFLDRPNELFTHSKSACTTRMCNAERRQQPAEWARYEPYQVPQSVQGCGISEHSLKSGTMRYEDVLTIFSNLPEVAQTESS